MSSRRYHEKAIINTIHYQKKSAMNTKVGETTKEYIEATREILKQQKKEAKEKTHEPS
jgi:hypothetical protein